MRRVPWMLCLVLAGCDGFGGPIVGVRPEPDAGPPMSCELGPMCRPWRTVPPERFEPPSALAPPDCDGDRVADGIDNCPGVPNATQQDACVDARLACERLAAGALALEGADLRGCEAEVALGATLSLAGADLRCARIRFTEGHGGRLDLRGASVREASLEIRAAVRVHADDALLMQASLTLGGGATLVAEDAILRAAHVRLEPSSVALEPPPALDLVRAQVFESVIEELDATRPGRIRMDECEVEDTLVVGPALEVIGGAWVRTSLAVGDVLVLGAELREAVIRADYAAFAGARVDDLVFDACGTVRFSGSDLSGVDVPPCDGALILETVSAIDSRFGGDLRTVGGIIRVSVIGSPGAAIDTHGTELEASRFCEPAAGRFVGGDLRCVKCGAHDFDDGRAVCLDGTRLFERGCPAIELAPECP